MSELISADAALRELLCGKRVERRCKSEWYDLDANDPIDVFFTSESFRIKPRTITINGIEVPAPDHIEKNPNLHGGWAINIGSEYYMYKSESNYNIVLAALRSVFGKK